ncbi:MAG: hypothetical protein QUV07_15225 [Cyanobium sp. CZS 25K]|nr:hypothetical protein [Cyanobium sp. CZS25K]
MTTLFSRLRPLPGALALLLAPPLAGALPALAQITQEDAYQRGRAVNLARMRAEVINGGLGVYRAASCMYERSGGACLVSADADGLRFRFFGGPPGAQELGQPPTLESDILISPDGRSVLEVLYNGPPRSQPAPAEQPQAQPGD